MRFYGEYLDKPNLRFDMSSTFATHYYSRAGLKRHGPYDFSAFNKDLIKAGIIYPLNQEQLAHSFMNKLQYGEGQFKGFSQWFKTKIDFLKEIPVEEEEEDVERAAKELSCEDIDIAFILTSKQKGTVYKCCKSIFSGNGIPCQFLRIERVFDKNFQWIIDNVALATYAKVGGVPWVVEKRINSQDELILGISRARDKSQKYIVGFVTIFAQNGEFLLMHSKVPVIEWEKYIDGLEKLILESYNEYLELRTEPRKIILHFHKRPGYKELTAVSNALDEIGNIPYALVHLNEFSSIRLFDTSDQTFVPKKGLKVKLSKKRFLLLLDGRDNGSSRRKVGVPNVLDINIDKRSHIDWQSDPNEIIKQIYEISHVNWRGFNAKTIPITINYSKLISRLVVEIGLENWNNMISSGKLKNKAWFL